MDFKNLVPSITKKKAQESLDLLKSIGYLKFYKRGRLYPSVKDIESPREVASMALMSYHYQMIELAKQSLSEISPWTGTLPV